MCNTKMIPGGCCRSLRPLPGGALDSWAIRGRASKSGRRWTLSKPIRGSLSNFQALGWWMTQPLINGTPDLHAANSVRSGIDLDMFVGDIDSIVI